MIIDEKGTFNLLFNDHIETDDKLQLQADFKGSVPYSNPNHKISLG